MHLNSSLDQCDSAWDLKQLTEAIITSCTGRALISSANITLKMGIAVLGECHNIIFELYERKLGYT